MMTQKNILKKSLIINGYTPEANKAPNQIK
jgi:hypothetical protein